MAEDTARGRWNPGPALLAWLFAATLTGLPYLRAHLAPPAGRSFVGSFYFIPDVYHYLSYVQQAQDGALLFRNKLVLEPQRPVLFNLEWWAVGRVAHLLGDSPLLAWRLLGLFGSLAFVLLADAWLRRCGLPDTHRLVALLLVFCATGIGGLLSRLNRPRGIDPLDLSTGLFPFLELLSNPHFVAGTCLVLGSLLALSSGGTRGTAIGVALAVVAGLSRPYDFVLIVAIRTLVVLATERPSNWRPLLLPLAAAAPVAAYDYWVFYVHPAFRVLSRHEYSVPSLGRLLLALAPAASLASVSLLAPPAGEHERRARAHLWAWLGAGAVVVMARPVSFALQFLVGYGFPLLALGALGLARWRPWVTLAVGLAFSSTALAALQIVLHDDPRWFVPSERLNGARALHAACRPGDVALAPGDVGLYAIGLSPCSSFVSHPVMSGYARRLEEARLFYERPDPAWRSALLDRESVTAVALPAETSPVPLASLGEATPFRLVAAVGQPPRSIGIYARAAAARSVAAP